MGNSIYTRVVVAQAPHWTQTPSPSHPDHFLEPWYLAVLADYLGESWFEVDDHTWTFSGSSGWGLVSDAVEWTLDMLRQLHIPFVAYSDPYDGCAGTLVVNDGAEEFEGSWADEIVLTHGDWNLIQTGTHRWAGEVTTYFTKMGLDVSTLDPAIYPTWQFPHPDEQEDAPCAPTD